VFLFSLWEWILAVEDEGKDGRMNEGVLGVTCVTM